MILINKNLSLELLLKKEVIRIGIHGIRGSFSHEATEKFLEYYKSEFPATEIVELIHAQWVFQWLKEDRADIWICAFANSGSGGYVETMEAMWTHIFEPLCMFVMPLNMCLLVRKEINSIDEVTRFYGHPVAIRQCEKTIESLYPDMLVEKCSDEMDTALSAKLLSEWQLGNTTGVFASMKAAQLYWLKVLKDKMHHDPNNATFFLVFKIK